MFADVILMNKSGLVSVGDRKRVATRIKVNVLLCQLNRNLLWNEFCATSTAFIFSLCPNITQHNEDLQDA